MSSDLAGAMYPEWINSGWLDGSQMFCERCEGYMTPESVYRHLIVSHGYALVAPTQLAAERAAGRRDGIEACIAWHHERIGKFDERGHVNAINGLRKALLNAPVVAS